MKKLMTLFFLLIVSSADAQTTDTAKVNTDSVYTKVDVEAQFPGGEKAWNKFVQSKIEANIKALLNDPASIGECTVKFIIDREGEITAAVPMNMHGSELAKLVVKAILSGPNWIPAEVKGIRVKSIRTQKVKFRTTDVQKNL